MIDKDEFDAWRDSEVTQAVFRLCEQKQAKAEVLWIGLLGGPDDIDPEELRSSRLILRTKVEVWGEIMDLAFEDIEESNEQERSG